jgi:hypothetical protein
MSLAKIEICNHCISEICSYESNLSEILTGDIGKHHLSGQADYAGFITYFPLSTSFNFSANVEMKNGF